MNKTEFIRFPRRRYFVVNMPHADNQKMATADREYVVKQKKIGTWIIENRHKIWPVWGVIVPFFI